MKEMSVPIKVIHVDDDPRFIRFFKKQLDTFPGIDYMGAFDSSLVALEYLEKETVDLIFLDVEMPGHDGLWMANQIKEKNISIVFVTSHAQYAIQAFEVCALDYLQKPTHLDRLGSLIDRVRNRPLLKYDEQNDQIDAVYDYLDPKRKPNRFFVNMIGNIKVIKLDEVLYFTSANNYTLILMENGEKQTASKTIKTFAEALSRNVDFLRVSRSFILNKDYINSIQRNSRSRRITVTMKNGEIIETSFKTKEEIMALLH